MTVVAIENLLLKKGDATLIDGLSLTLTYSSRRVLAKTPLHVVAS